MYIVRQMLGMSIRGLAISSLPPLPTVLGSQYLHILPIHIDTLCFCGHVGQYHIQAIAEHDLNQDGKLNMSEYREFLEDEEEEEEEEKRKREHEAKSKKDQEDLEKIRNYLAN